MNIFRAIWLLSWILVATLPICAIIVAVALFHWRKHPRLKDVLNFKRPFWVAYFISLGAIAFGLAVVYWIAPVYHSAYQDSDPLGLMALPFVLLMLVGVFSCFVSSVRFFWCLMAAIKHHD
jgi:uncharacterized membrane protein YcjF (UPF0283 family)